MTPTRYRKKPVVIEAVQYDGSNAEEVAQWIDDCSGEFSPAHTWGDEFRISTLEGELHVSPGDYVIRGVQGEFYPCKPDIFEQTYEHAS
jgi:hypothetical protein